MLLELQETRARAAELRRQRELIEAARYAADPVAWAREVPEHYLWSKQREIIEALKTHRRVAVKSCHGVGKALALDTPLPTPHGWTTMGAVRVGDALLDERGRPVTVLATSEIQHRDTYAVRFDDGSEIIASDNHRWQVVDLRHRPRRIEDWRDHWDATITRTTVELARDLRVDGQLRWRIPTASAVEGTPWAERLGQEVGQRSRHTQRTIVAVERVATVPTKCVAVDSLRRLFLAGRSMIPTHNSDTASVAAAWWIATHPPDRVFLVTTAPTFAQVRAILWRYIRVLHKRGKLAGKVNQTEWHIDGELRGFGRKPADTDNDAFQGIHGDVLVVLDEACGIPEQLWIAADALTTNPSCRILAIGNPDNPGTHFKTLFDPGSSWHQITISAFDSPNLTGEDIPPDVAEYLISRQWVEEKRREWGEGNPIYLSKVLGEFPTQDPLAIVRIEDVMACRYTFETPRTEEEQKPIELGVDVGGGGDLTVIRERRGMVAGREWTSNSDRPEDLAPLVLRAIRETGATAVKIDTIGIGYGLAGELRNRASLGEHEATIIGVNVSEAAQRPDLYANKRAELWWEVGRLGFEQRAVDVSSMENADRTIAELVDPRYSIDPKGRIKVESKDEIRDRASGRSPDHADAWLLAYYVAPGAAAAADWLARYAAAKKKGGA